MATKEDIYGLIKAIDSAKRKDGKPIAPISRRKIKLTLRKFVKWQVYPNLNNKKLLQRPCPEIVADIEPDSAKNTLSAEDMLTEQNVQALIKKCKNPMHKAAISLLWSGLRCGELLNLTMLSVKVVDGEVHLVVNGKAGERMDHC